VVDNILTQEPSNPQLNQIIFINENNVLYLKKYDGTSFITLDITNGLLCFVKNDNEVYIKLTNWEKVIKKYNIYNYNVDEITLDDTTYSSDYILYQQSENNYIFKKWNNDHYEQDDSLIYGTRIYINNTNETYIKKKYLNNEQNWIKEYTDIENINIKNQITLNEDITEYYEKNTENISIKPDFYIKNSKNEIYGFKNENIDKIIIQNLIYNNNLEITNEELFEGILNNSIIFNQKISILINDILYAISTDNKLYIIDLSKSINNISIKYKNINVITENYIIFGIVLYNDLLHILTTYNNNIQIITYNILTEEFNLIENTEQFNTSYPPSSCCIYKNNNQDCIYIGTNDNDDNIYILYSENNNYTFGIMELILTGINKNNNNVNLFVCNDDLFIYYNGNQQYIYRYNQLNHTIYSIDLTNNITLEKYWIDDNNNIYFIINTNDSFLKIDYDCNITYINSTDSSIEKQGFINFILIKNKLIFKLNMISESSNYGYYGYYYTTPNLLINKHNLSYNGLININDNNTIINNNIINNGELITNTLNTESIILNNDEIIGIDKSINLGNNNTIPTTDKVQEMINSIPNIKNTFYVNEISTEEPQVATEGDIIFIENNNIYTLKQYINEQWINYPNIEIDSICIVNNDDLLFILTEINNNIQTWIKKEFIDKNKTLNLTNNSSINTIGDIKIGCEYNELTGEYENEKISLNKNGIIQSEELIVGKVRLMYSDILQFTSIFYGQSNNDLYIIDNNYNVYYLNINTMILQQIYIDNSSILFDIISAFIYNNYLYIFIKYLDEGKNKYKLLAYNGINKVYTYTNMVNSDVSEAPSFNSFIKTIVINDNDVYIVNTNKLYLLLFVNQVPNNFIELLDYSDSPINEPMNDIYNITNYIYILCQTKYYKYDINNYTITSIIYNYQDTSKTYIYKYSIINNNTLYFKYEGINNIYYLDDTDEPIIKQFISLPLISNDTVCHFNINNNEIYYINEQYDNNTYKYTFYTYNIIMHKLSNEQIINNYNLNIPFNSNIPILIFNNGLLLIDSTQNYNTCRLTLPLMEISGLNTYIKNFKITDDNIILASKRVVIPNDLINTKLVTKDIIVKNYDININDKNMKINWGVEHFYQTTKGFYHFASPSNSSNLRCVALPVIKQISYQGIIGTNENMQFAVVYNDYLYVLIGNLVSGGMTFKVFDVEKNSNNVYSVALINTFPITNNDNYVLNEYYYDENIIIDNILYVFNAVSHKLFKCNMLNENLNFEYVKTFDNLQTNVLPTQPEKNANYANVEQILTINNNLYFVYYNMINNVKVYNIYYYNLSTDISYNINIKLNNENVSFINYCVVNDEKIYLNIINQYENLRGIYYIDNLNEGTSDLKLYPLFADNAYSFNIIDNKFFVITTQYNPNRGPQIFSYYFNYFNYEDNVLQQTKFVEKRDYNKFNSRVPPIILDNSDILLIDSNKQFNMYVASLFSHMISPERTVLHNNAVFTKNYTDLYNSLYVSNNSCKVYTNPYAKDDVVNKNYVDNKIKNIDSITLPVNTDPENFY